MNGRFLVSLLFFVFIRPLVSGGCAAVADGNDLACYADGVFIGAVVDQETDLGEDGRVWTHTVVRVDGVAKGFFPPYVRVSTLGGEYEGWGDYDSRHQQIGNWPRALFLVKRSGSLLTLIEGLGAIVLPEGLAMDGLATQIWDHAKLETGAEFDEFKVEAISQRVVTSTGYLGDTNPSRLLWPDRGEPVPVLLDLDALPPGMSQSDALTAVDNALAAWAEVSSLAFYIEGTVSFGQAADDVDIDDQRLRLQLHDLHGAISNGSTTLGIGGRSNSVNSGAGGTVKGQAFNPTRRAYVVMDHDKSTLQNVVAFEEVLTHEIGHALGLSHSSETASESDAALRDAIMYFRVKNDGRGASLASYDIEKIRGIHPVDNTPPFGFDRDFTMVTSFSSLPTYINSMKILGGDLQGDGLSLELVDVIEGAGTFALDGDTLSISPAGAFGDSDASGSSFFARAVLRFSDGVNLSPTFTVRVVSLRIDSGSDGLPDAWAQDEFGTTDTGGNRGPLDDFDEDGWTNFQEFRWGLDPEVKDTLITNFDFDGATLDLSGKTGIPFALYQSTDLSSWSVRNVFNLEATTGNQVRVSSEPSSAAFYQLVPID